MYLRKLFSAAFAAAWLFAPLAFAADFPDRPVRLVVGFAPGGGTDILARQLAQALTEKWGKAVVVENRPGGNGTIANELVSRATPDGYTVLFTPGDFALMPSMIKLNYDPVKDLEPVALLAGFPGVVMINPALPAKTLQEFVDYAKTKPDALNYGSSGVGSIPSLDTIRLLDSAGVKMMHVPYKGTGPAMTALMAGEVQLVIGGLASSLPYISSGSVRALAITSRKRSPLLPELPTVAEALKLPSYAGENWYGVMVPAGTPKEVVGKLHDAFVEALKTEKVQQSLQSQGVVTIGSSPAEFKRILAEDIAKWADVLMKFDPKDTGRQVDVPSPSR